MISPHFNRHRPSAASLRLAPALIVSLLARPAEAMEAPSPAQQLTGQAGRSVLPTEPGKLRWDRPGGTLWEQGEASVAEPDPSPVAEPGLERGAVALGARQELALMPHLSLAIAPQLRVEATADAHGLPTTRTLNGTMQQDLTLTLPGEVRLFASIGIADRIGAAALGPAGASRVLHTRASVALQGRIAGTPIRTEFQVSTARSLAAEHVPDRLLSCELGLVVTWVGHAPLRLAGSCPGESIRRVTLGINATF